MKLKKLKKKPNWFNDLLNLQILFSNKTKLSIV